MNCWLTRVAAVEFFGGFIWAVKEEYMKFHFGRVMAVLALFLLSWQILTAQIAKMIPEKLHWGESAVLTYDPAAKGAKFLPGDEIFALYTFLNADSYTKGQLRLERKDGPFRPNSDSRRGGILDRLFHHHGWLGRKGRLGRHDLSKRRRRRRKSVEREDAVGFRRVRLSDCVRERAPALSGELLHLPG